MSLIPVYSVKLRQTIVHLFYDCIYVKFFWIDVENMFESLCGIKINLQKRDIIFYFEKKVMDQSHFSLLNLFILFRQYYVHKCKWTERKPNIHQFKKEMRIYFDTLTGIMNRKAIRTVALYRALRSSL